MTLAAIVRGHSNVGTGEPVWRQKLCCRARALKHRDLSATRDQGLNDAWEDRDAETAGNADCGLLAIQVEAAPERTQEVNLMTLMTPEQPGAPGANHVEDESDSSVGRIRPGSTVGPAQDGVWCAHRQLEELPRSD